MLVSHFIIECDVTNEPEILKHLLSNDCNSNIMARDDTGQESSIINNLGLTLFTLLYKETSDVLYNEF